MGFVVHAGVSGLAVFGNAFSQFENLSLLAEHFPVFLVFAKFI